MAGEVTETDFASLVSELAADPNRQHELVELLREDHERLRSTRSSDDYTNARVGFA